MGCQKGDDKVRDVLKCQLNQPNHVIRIIMNSLTIRLAYTRDGCYLKP